MRLSLRWLKQYLPIELTLAEVVHTLTMLGLEVESVTDLGYESRRLVTCEILEIHPHPNADKLVLCTVMADEAKPIQVVCGATNMKVGDRVVLAKVGAKLPPSAAHPEGLTLKAAKIRNVASHGMLCSGPEMTYNDDMSGLMILPPDTQIAEPFDALLEIKVTPNRPDCLSVIGVARELAAATRRRLQVQRPEFAEAEERADSVVKIQVLAREACPRYMARVARGVKIGPSPAWLRMRVESAGLRSINNVVDVTNYVLMEFGHPLHAFDLAKIAQRRVIIRLAQEGEAMETLDGARLALTAEDLVITDPNGPIALAGIMGGLNSEISEDTTEVLIECAYFNPPTIRRTSKRHDKSTDSSYRFERGVDPKKMALALDRAAELIAKTAGGEILRGAIDVLGPVPEQKSVWISIERLNRALDMKLSGRDIADTLTALGFEILRTDPDRLQALAPSHRVDITREADLIEEVARLRGYDKTPPSLPKSPARSHPESPLRQLRARLSSAMVAAGFTETINYSFVAEEDLARAGAPVDRLVRLANPLSREQSVMRTSMLPGILANARKNQNFSAADFALFEIGKIYFAPPPAEEKSEEEAVAAGTPDPRVPAGLPPAAIEQTWLIAALSEVLPLTWKSVGRMADFFDMKGVAEALIEALGRRRARVEPAADVAHLHPGRAAALTLEGKRVCWFGELNPALARAWDLRRRLYILEMPLDPLVESGAAAADSSRRFRELPRYPAVERDLALVVDRSTLAADVEQTLRGAEPALLENIRLFDVYEGEKIGAGKRSLAYSLTLRAADRTLTEEEAAASLERILEAARARHGAALRGA